MGKKKLAIITSHPIQYNVPAFVQLTKRGNIDVKVFYTWGEDGIKDKYDPGFGKIINWDIPLLEGYEYEFVKNVSKERGSHHFKGIICPDLNKSIIEWGANAILVYGWNFHAHFNALRFFYKKIPVLFRGDSTLLDEKSGIQKLVRRLFLRYVYSFVDFALYVGTNNKKYFLAHGLKERQLIYTPHAIDNARFQADVPKCEEEAQAIRRSYDIPKEDIVFLFAGKLSEKKNPALLIEAFKNAGKKGYLFIVGNGPLEVILKNECKDDNRIIFLDFQNQSKMPVIYRVANVFVLPSSGPGETWGLAINEAMACGRMVVASNKCGGATDLIVNGENGYIFEAQNLEQLTSLVAGIIDSYQLIPEMGNSSLKRVALFDLASFGREVERIVTEGK